MPPGTGAVSTAPVVVLISVDPRTSHRAFEAMRIGVGIVAGENDVRFVLTDGAVHLLDEDTDELVDGDDIGRFRASLRTLGIPFHVEEAARPAGAGWNTEGHPIVSVTRRQIVELVSSARRLLVF
jgi:hypothetical protein